MNRSTGTEKQQKKKEPKKKGNRRPSNWEARLRMGFLYDAAKIMTQAHHEEEKKKTNPMTEAKDVAVEVRSDVYLDLGCHYTTVMKDISRKTVTRMY